MKLNKIYLLPLLVSLYSFALFGWSLIAQQSGMHVCFLCIIQRYIFLGCGLIGILATFSKLKKYEVLNIILAFIGILVSSYQIWLSFNPLNACSMPFNVALKSFGFLHAMQHSIADYSCSKLIYLFGINIPIWALVAFIIIFILSFISIIRKKTS